jgi:hypothetical protein
LTLPSIALATLQQRVTAALGSSAGSGRFRPS